MEKPYGPLDPNSQHQMWSRWIFGVKVDGPAQRRPLVQEVVDNARKYFAVGFQSTVGRVRCDEQDGYYVIVLEIEGVPAHDPDLRRRVQVDFEQRFMRPGFGSTAVLSRFTCGILAGDCQDGTPPTQLLVMPAVDFSARLHVM